MFTCYILLDVDGVTNLAILFPAGKIFTPIKCVYILIHLYMLAIVFLACNLMVAYTITYCYYITIFYTIELRLGQKPSIYRTVSKLRDKPENLCLTYRAFQVLNQYLLEFFGPILLITHGGMMYMTCICNVVLLRYWDYMEPLAKAPVITGGLVCVLAWTFVLEFGRLLFSKGTKVISSWSKKDWKNVHASKLMKTFQKSCKPLVLAYGSSFVIKKLTMLNFYKGISRGTMRLLLSK